MKKSKAKTSRFVKFNVAGIGMRASIDNNGYIRIYNAPIMKCGRIRQSISTFGELINSDAITGKDKCRGWAWALRSASDVFSKKTMDSFIGCPIMYRGHAGPYKSCTALVSYVRDKNEPIQNKPIGTVLAVRRGRGRIKDFLLADIIIWNVNYLAKSIEGGYINGIAAATKLLNVVVRSDSARIKQVKLCPNSLYLCPGNIWGFNIFDKKTKFFKWFQKQYIESSEGEYPLEPAMNK